MFVAEENITPIGDDESGLLSGSDGGEEAQQFTGTDISSLRELPVKAPFSASVDAVVHACSPSSALISGIEVDALLLDPLLDKESVSVLKVDEVNLLGLSLEEQSYLSKDDTTPSVKRELGFAAEAPLSLSQVSDVSAAVLDDTNLSSVFDKEAYPDNDNKRLDPSLLEGEDDDAEPCSASALVAEDFVQVYVEEATHLDLIPPMEQHRLRVFLTHKGVQQSSGPVIPQQPDDGEIAAVWGQGLDIDADWEDDCILGVSLVNESKGQIKALGEGQVVLENIPVHEGAITVHVPLWEHFEARGRRMKLVGCVRLTFEAGIPLT